MRTDQRWIRIGNEPWTVYIRLSDVESIETGIRRGVHSVTIKTKGDPITVFGDKNWLARTRVRIESWLRVRKEPIFYLWSESE